MLFFFSLLFFYFVTCLSLFWFTYNFVFSLQKRDSGGTTLTSSDGDKSSGTKSFTAPSTPQAESVNFHVEPRNSNSLITESIPADNLSLQETPLVCSLSYIIYMCM